MFEHNMMQKKCLEYLYFGKGNSRSIILIWPFSTNKSLNFALIFSH